MDGSLWHCTGDRDEEHSQEKEMQKSKININEWVRKKTEKSVKSKTEVWQKISIEDEETFKLINFQWVW